MMFRWHQGALYLLVFMHIYVYMNIYMGIYIYENILLYFQVFSFASKKVQGFSSDKLKEI